MKINFLGDISLNDDYIRLYKEGKNPFAEIEPVLAEADFVVGNLECLAKGDQGENELKKPRLATTLETLNYLKNIRLKVASLAHNHVYDHLEDGFSNTTNFLKANAIQYLGAGFTPEEAAKPVILKHGDISVGLLNYVTADTNPNLPENAGIFLNDFDINKCKNDIMELKSQVEHVVLLLHWGGRVEGGLYPDWDQPRIARTLIDAGADLIIGHHSHTVQPFEVYKGKYIFYSLGNFCFSDYWFDGEFYRLDSGRKQTIILNVSFANNKYVVNYSFFENRIDTFVNIVKYGMVFQNRNHFYKFILKNKTIWNMYYLKLKIITPLKIFLERDDLTTNNKIRRIASSFRKRYLKLI